MKKLKMLNREEKTVLFFATIAMIAILFQSCIPKPIDIELKPPQPKLVIASQIFPNSIMLVSVSRSFSALNDASQNNNVTQNFLDSILVKNAFVTVAHGAVVDTLVMLTPGIYGSLNVLQQTGGQYNLYVKDRERNLEVTANSTLLPQVRFDTVVPRVVRNATDTAVFVKYTFRDDPLAENYYVVNYVVKLQDSSASVDLNTFFQRGRNKVLTDFDLISDATFSGTFTKETRLWKAHGSDTIAVVLSNISKGYYEFLTAFKRAGGIMTALTGEPINYPTNVQGGYGYFNTHYPDVRFYYLRQY